MPSADRLRRLPLLAATALFCAHPAEAASCSVSTVGVSFGAYDSLSLSNRLGSGTVNVTCDVATGYSIAISPGKGSYADRVMAGPSSLATLRYNLYTDSSRTIVWGDGSAGTATLSASGTSGRHTVYGRIPARQTVRAGSYSDVLVVTIVY